MPGEDGIWVFIFGDLLIFGIFFGTYLYYRAEDVALYAVSQQALNTTFGLVNTVLLLTSSLFVVVAVSAVRNGITRHVYKLVAGAMACGIAFSILKIVEYGSKIDMGITPQTNNFYMFYFFLTGLHWFHLIIGLGALTYMLLASRRTQMDARQVGWFEGAGCYWHMVDLIWIVLFPLLYLVN